ncbi:MAG TPA: hypothetical protein VFN35_24370, partial [Ktedonobacteraceae bacterium]|nr:hypothetical protein [Ktedonobacteraceae bacterium]
MYVIGYEAIPYGIVSGSGDGVCSPTWKFCPQFAGLVAQLFQQIPQHSATCLVLPRTARNLLSLG